MERLLDFSKPVDVPLLEQVVTSLNTATDAVLRAQANQVLTALKEHPSAWKSAGTVLAESKDMATRFFALQVLEEAIKYRWKALPGEQRQGIRNYVVQKIVDTTSVDGYTNDPGQKLFVNKLNLILVHILKQEWPHNWPNFIPEIVGSSSKSEVLCENNMHVLKLLSEEVFEFSKEEMRSEKIKQMKQQLNNEFRQIFELCQLVLNSSQRPSLILVTLQTLLRFLAWIPLGYIFETPLVEQLLTKFLPNTTFRNDTLACLTEIAAIDQEVYNPVFQSMFTSVIALLQRQLPPQTDIEAEYERAQERERIFIRGLSLFFCSIFSHHLDILEKPENHQATMAGMVYLVNISMVDDKEIFKICLEFWNQFCKDLFESERGSYEQTLVLGGVANQMLKGGGQRSALYNNTILPRLRTVMISKMAKPEEVLVVEDDDGSIVRETTKDTDAIAQYKTMRDTLVYLCHLDCDDTENIMLAKLSQQCDERNDQNFSFANLNTLCWAIGSISGAMKEDDEKRFLVTVIKDLLNMCEQKKGKDNKAVVASNIMYVVGQYPRFLRAHWKFLRTVVNKLFEFMHELHPGVQDMACDTFLKIAQKCKSQFVVLQNTERQPFIQDLLSQMLATTRDLSPHQRHTFYEAVGYMVREEQNEMTRNGLLEKLMQPASVEWKRLMEMGNQNADSLSELGHIQALADILRVNVRVCTAMGYAFRPHLMSFYLDMLHVYKFYSGNISQSIRQGGEVVIQHKQIKVMRVVKVEILKLIEVFLQKADNVADIANTFCPPLLEPVLGDYQQSVPAARNAEVLQLFVVVVSKLKGATAEAMDGTMVEKVLAPLFNPTLAMITSDFTEFPEHRINFYKLLKVLNQYAFQRLFSTPEETQKNVINAVVFAFKHTERNIAETGLEIMDALLGNVAKSPDQFAQTFYQAYYLSILQDVLYVLTDRLHKSSFAMHATILRHLFHIVANGAVKVPLGPGAANNQAFLQQYVSNMIGTAFPNVAKRDVEQFVLGLFDSNKDNSAFKAHLRDFLITLKEFSGDDNDQLFLQEREEQARLSKQQQLQARAAIPGLLTQAEKDEMADL